MVERALEIKLLNFCDDCTVCKRITLLITLPKRAANGKAHFRSSAPWTIELRKNVERRRAIGDTASSVVGFDRLRNRTHL